MERRVFIAVLLSFAVLYGYQALFVPPSQKTSPTTTTSTTVPPSAPRPGPSTSPAATSPEAAPAAADNSAVEALVSESAPREIVVETRDAEIVLSNQGARVVHWRLKSYMDPTGSMVDLVPSDLPATEATPFMLRVQDQAVTKQIQTVLYRVTGDQQGKVDATTEARAVEFTYQDAGGLLVKKILRFQPSRNMVTLTADVRSGSSSLNPTVLWGPGLGDQGASAGGGSFLTGSVVQPPQAILHRDGKVERHAADALLTQPGYDGNFRFVGINDHYFIATAVNGGQVHSEFVPVTLPSAEGQAPRRLVSMALTFAKPPADLTFFVGPKQFDLLRSVDAELVRAIDFGMFAWLVVPLLGALKWLFGFVGNYGWSIIALTIGINLAMFPLRHKSTVAMRKMQAIQPRMKAIQDRYTSLKITDPARQKMNEEIAELYKKEGVNPASGCVPMLLTLPVLLAFYALLSQSIELRGAPFVGWIHDLSSADPYYVLPILMGVTMMWQQWLTPAAMDPAQQKVMMVMPIMFTGMMLLSPSGVVLYWFVSQLWAIGQQYFTNWMIGPAPQPARPAVGRK
jgi:YidC/Oxa1 family membrane protein insertase